ncbi:hypothetical protein H6P81_019884 [Aristolochia fimbriata]|uniref:Uncharacterized protein n=1 Tax=Aristolochia fimbriata TaxID=158543 RepID=A0AAV7DUS6_ARIFI|nr:hypothetical protein H6P81_019884 [Aristolochia fimbriata]
MKTPAVPMFLLLLVFLSLGENMIWASQCVDPLNQFYICSKYKTIDSVLARGERLDNLVEKSSDLSAASQDRSAQNKVNISKLKVRHTAGQK